MARPSPSGRARRASACVHRPQAAQQACKPRAGAAGQRGGLVAFGDHERGGQGDQHTDERHAQVDQRDDAEVAQHPDVRQRQHAEAGDRRDARGGDRGARALVASAQRPDRVLTGEALLAEALGEQHAELGRDRDHERTQRDGHRVQRHANCEQDQRRPSGRQHDWSQRRQCATAIAPEGEQQHERHGGEPCKQCLQASPRGGHLRAGLGRQHRQAHELGADAGRRVKAPAHLVDQLLLLVESHQANPESERRPVAVGRDHVLREVRRDRRKQPVDLRL